MTLLLDASFSLAWIFARERPNQAEQAERVLQSRSQQVWVVPALWPLEVTNALLVAERRGVIQPNVSEAFLGRLAALRIEVDSETMDLAQPRILKLARQHQLSAYDATYLDLALRLNAQLATFDQRLMLAADAAGCRQAEGS